MSSIINSQGAEGAPINRILVVEDEFLIRLTLSEVLEDEGYEVIEAESGDEAMKIIEASPDIAVLLTDIQLPGKLDGRALVQRAREILPDLPVIFMTGRPDVFETKPGSKDIYVAKPYLPSQICDAVRTILSGQQTADP